jgi:hypothetical protein
MYPILFEIGDWPVYSYGVLLALAYLAGLQLAVMRARRAGLDSARIMDLGIYLIIAALIGAKLMLVVVDFEYFRDRPGELLSLVRVGGVFYGGSYSAGDDPLAVAPLWLVALDAADLFAWHRSGTWWAASAACSRAAATDARPTCRGASRSPIRLRPETSARHSAPRSIRRSSTTREPSC